jgi:hypothetical protein
MKINVTKLLDDVFVIDGLFSRKEASEIQQYAEEKQNYSLTGDYETRIYTFAAVDAEDKFDKYQFKILYRFKEMCDHLGIERCPTFQRVITNCFGINDFCDAHTDSPIPGNVTFLLYGNTEWHGHWGGETFFTGKQKGTYGVYVSPAPGRLVISPTEIWHGTRAPTQFMRAKGRISMAWQCEELELPEQERWYNVNKDKLKSK